MLPVQGDLLFLIPPTTDFSMNLQVAPSTSTQQPWAPLCVIKEMLSLSGNQNPTLEKILEPTESGQEASHKEFSSNKVYSSYVCQTLSKTLSGISQQESHVNWQQQYQVQALSRSPGLSSPNLARRRSHSHRERV